MAKAAAPLGTHGFAEPAGEHGQSTSKVARITGINGRDSLRVGVFENYSVRIAPGAEQPIVYRWSMGDGTLATGNYITHRYERPGRYEIIVTARNRRGSDADTLVVTVTEPPKEVPPVVEVADNSAPSPSASRDTAVEKPAPRPVRNPVEAALRGYKIDWPKGGYTLIAASRMTSKDAEAVALRYRRAGYRAGIVVVTEGRGSTVYRILIGQFATDQDAVRGRHVMLERGHGGAFIVEGLPGGTPTDL